MRTWLSQVYLLLRSGEKNCFSIGKTLSYLEIDEPIPMSLLIPFSDKVSVSTKIKDRKERNRLKSLIRSIKPKNFGVIIRTVAQERKVAELDKDLKNLVKNIFQKHLSKTSFKNIYQKHIFRKSEGPFLDFCRPRNIP